jgi:hypothetical protein
VNVPSYRDALNAEYTEASYLFFDKLFKEGLGVREMLTSTSGFVGPGLAALYGVAAPASGYVERDLGPTGWLLLAAAYLTLNAINGEPHSILRGVSINLDILCVDPGAPAADIPSVPELKPDQTNRERITALTAGCGGTCHNSFINRWALRSSTSTAWGNTATWRTASRSTARAATRSPRATRRSRTRAS